MSKLKDIINQGNRIQKILDYLIQITSGNYKVHMEPSKQGDNLDGIIYGLTCLKDELEYKEKIRTADIQTIKESEAKLIESLSEKEVLLSEIHHRVKNNMQIISSLLSLQAGTIKDNKVKSLLKVSNQRIKVMARIHEMLYSTSDFSRINYSVYVKSLVRDLSHANANGNTKILMNIDIDDIFLNGDTAIPLGLIINELVTNSFKYAFKNRSEGAITIKITKQKKKKYNMTVSDDGVGIPKDIDLKKPPSLGLTLVNILVNQLHGKIEMKNKPGTKFNINFCEN